MTTLNEDRFSFQLSYVIPVVALGRGRAEDPILYALEGGCVKVQKRRCFSGVNMVGNGECEAGKRRERGATNAV